MIYTNQIGFFIKEAHIYVFWSTVSAVWCSAPDTHLKLLDYAVSGATFLTVGELECTIAHSTICGSVCVTRIDLIANQYTYAPPRSKNTQYNFYLPLSIFVERPCVRWCGISRF